MVMSEEGLVEVSDGQRHSVIVTIGTVENNILKQNRVMLTVDGKHAHMDIFGVEKDRLKTNDPFFGGLPTDAPYYGISRYTGTYWPTE